MAEEKKTTTQKKDVDENFNYLVRIASTDLDGNKNVELALTGISGIGRRLATLAADFAEVPRKVKIGLISDEQIAALEESIKNIGEVTPVWMLNRQNDYETGGDFHILGNDVKLTVREDINREKKVRSNKGIRHENGLPVRGQKTRSNGRHGLTVGVSRKK